MDEVIKLLSENKNIFLTGAGGTGKSYIIKQLTEINNTFSVTSTTGISALSINGQTIHRFSGIGRVDEKSFEGMLKKVKKNKNALKNIKLCRILIIDEISMLSGEILELLDYIFKQIREVKKTFGGIQVIFTGDFYQLPPVEGDYCFLSKVWTKLKLNTVFLKTEYRFIDNEYSDLLKCLRRGSYTQEHINMLNSRINVKDEKNEDIKPTFLFSKNNEVEYLNNKEMENLNTKEKIYYADDVDGSIFQKSKKEDSDEDDDTSDNDIDLEIDDKLEVLAPSILKLKIGAQVMITINIDLELGIANGTRGVVVSLSDNTVDVKILSGNTVTISKYNYELKKRKRVLKTRMQFPLKLAWAMSIHKSQGSTLDLASIDLGSVFCASQAYVALSRIRSLNGLHILKRFNPKRIFVNDEVTTFYNNLENTCLKE